MKYRLPFNLWPLMGSLLAVNQLAAHLPPVSEQFSPFWSSIDRIEKLHNEKFAQIAQQIEDIASQGNILSSPCIELFKTAFRHGLKKQWSAQMLSANAFTPAVLANSLLNEQFTSTGNFHGCLSSTLGNLTQETPLGLLTFSSQYCIATLSMAKQGFNSNATQASHLPRLKAHFANISSNWSLLGDSYPLALGICSPSLCSSQELTQLLAQYFADYLEGMNLQVGYCQVAGQSSIPWRPFAFTLSAIILTLLLLIPLLATFLSLYLKCSTIEHSQVLKYVQCFNIASNLDSLFKVAPRNVPSQRSLDLTFIYGLKFFLLFPIVVGHSFTYLLVFSKLAPFAPFPSFFHGLKTVCDRFSHNVISGFLLMDASFMISAFLVTNSCLSKNSTLPSFFTYAFRRWLRPVLSMAIILSLTIIAQHLGTGPLFHGQLTQPFVQPCFDYWWTHLLLISNFWTLDKMCNPSVWFVAAQFQCYLLFYPIICLYYTRRRWAIPLSILLTSSISILYLIYAYLRSPRMLHFDSILSMNDPNLLEAVRWWYTHMAPHMFSYLVGVILAIKGQQVKQMSTCSLFHNIQKLLLSLVICCLLLLLKVTFLQIEKQGQVKHFLAFLLLYSVTIITFGRFLYLLLQNSFPFTCIFTYPLVVFLGRLSFGVYLTNLLVIWFVGMQRLEIQRLSGLLLLTNALSTYIYSLFLALLLYVSFEGPFRRLCNLIGKKPTKAD